MLTTQLGIPVAYNLSKDELDDVSDISLWERFNKMKEIIGRHLQNMIGGTIAVITAVLIVNVKIEPVWIWWVLSTVLMVPVIIWLRIKVMK